MAQSVSRQDEAFRTDTLRLIYTSEMYLQIDMAHGVSNFAYPFSGSGSLRSDRNCSTTAIIFAVPVVGRIRKLAQTESNAEQTPQK